MKAISFKSLQSLNSKYNAFTSIRKPKTLYIEENGPLAGTTSALKDLFCTKHEPTTCSSEALESFIAPYDSTVATLLESSGTQIVGKTNMDEFGMGNSTLNTKFNPTLNPLYTGKGDPDIVTEYEDKGAYIRPIKWSKLLSSSQRIVGGSSGGSAAAVAGDLVDFAIGSDTGGSVRLPAAYTGIYGFKPTYGRVSRWGMIAYAQSLDTVGIFAKDIGTIWKVFGVLDVHDPKDPTSLSEKLREEISTEWMKQMWVEEKRPIRIGIPEEFVLNEMNSSVREKWFDLLDNLKEKHEIVTVSIPSIKNSLAAYYTLVTAEAASNLARYDGNRYGFKKEDLVNTRTEALGDEVKRRITLGNFTLSSYGFESHYMKAMDIRSQLISEFNAIFRDRHVLNKLNTVGDGVDFVLSPTATSLPPLVKDFKSISPVKSYMNDVLTVPASLAGLPTINIPYKGFGFQIMGQHGMDYKALQFAHKLSTTTTTTLH